MVLLAAAPTKSDSIVGAYAYLDYIKELDRRQALYDAAARRSLSPKRTKKLPPVGDSPPSSAKPSPTYRASQALAASRSAPLLPSPLLHHAVISRKSLGQLTARLAAMPPHKQRLAGEAKEKRRATRKSLMASVRKERSRQRPTMQKAVVTIQRYIRGALARKRRRGRAARAGGGANIADQNARAREIKTLQSIFKWLDRDGDGHISTADLHSRLRGLGGRLRRSEVSQIIWEVDDDMDGQLSWQDFLNAYFRSQADASGFEPKRFFFVAECAARARARFGRKSRARFGRARRARVCAITLARCADGPHTSSLSPSTRLPLAGTC